MAGGQSRTPRAHGRRPKPDAPGAWPEAKAGATQKNKKSALRGKGKDAWRESLAIREEKALGKEI